MHSADQLVSARLATASETLTASTVDPELREATRPEFGNFQTSLPLRLAKKLNVSPREAARQLLAVLDVADLCEPPEFAGRGFLNFTLKAEYLADHVTAIAGDERLGVPTAAVKQRIVIDYSQPNVAKEMHVGHLRSTVIGDALSRILEFAGHEVIRQNHIGDWGTQFGMLIEQLLDENVRAADLGLDEMSALYRRARRHFDGDPLFADRSRARVVALQASDEVTVALWRQLVAVSLEGFDAVYRHLGVRLTAADVMGESAYNDDLPRLVEELARLGLLTESNGASCVFSPGIVGRDGNPLPMIVRKSDGGFGYSATDLAAVRHRVARLRADRLVYVVDARQSLHFEQVFAVARQAGWLPDAVSAEHVRFGTVLDEGGQPFKSRDGEVVPLTELLRIAQQEAAALLATRGSSNRDDLSRAVGVGAVKYADLSAGRSRDYVFAVHRMVALDGNTGPYLQYAHARLCSVLRRADSETPTVTAFSEPGERQLAYVLTRYPAAVAETLQMLEPHRLSGYLYRLATAVSVFYQRCPVLQDGVDPLTRDSRLALCDAARRTLAHGLDLLGIQAPESM